MFSPDPPRPGDLTLITDQLAASGDFLLHRFQAAHLRHSALAKCIIIAVSEDAARWTAISARSSIHLSKSVRFIEIKVAGDVDPPQLHEVYDRTSSALNERTSDEETLVILEEAATLQWVGVPSAEVKRFCRALSFLCRKKNCALLIRHHVINPAEPDDILRHLLQLSDLHIEVRPLSSGKSDVVTGEISMHVRSNHQSVSPIPRSTAIQYRLTESGPTFFGKGTGVGLL